MKAKKIKTIAYTYIIGDLFHYGHLQLLKKAKIKADFHICGIISDNAADRWQSPLICNYNERSSVIEQVKYVDEIMKQDTLDPSDNLEKIRKKYPYSKIYFFPMYQKWDTMHGAKLIKNNGGEIVKINFYDKLSRAKIKRAFIKSSEYLAFDDVSEDKKFMHTNSTKAETLVNLSPKLTKSFIEKLFTFTVKDWNKSNISILTNSKKIFGKSRVIVRSSSLNEDSLTSSSAGMYHSELNVDNSNYTELKNAINKVKESYKKGKKDNFNQIIVQKQSDNIAVSGVCLTRNLKDNSPYYIINFDDKSSSTDTVTSGLVSDKVEIIRNINPISRGGKWNKLIVAVREIENLMPSIALDIEFAINKKNEVIIFQVRPLAANSKFPTHNDAAIFSLQKSILEEYQNNIINNKNEIILSDMGFWNPAELIGDRPLPLTVSLFKKVLMEDVWNNSLKSLGYGHVKGNLIHMIGNKPYINLDKTFDTLIPANIEAKLKNKIKKFFNTKIKKYPQYHDKLEFEITLDHYNFSTESKLNELIEHDFTKNEINKIRLSLFKLTNDIFYNHNKIFIEDTKSIKHLISCYKKSKKDSLQSIAHSVKHNIFLLKKYGTPQFCRAARLAFIGKSFLKSFSDQFSEYEEDCNILLSGIKTISSKMQEDLLKIKNSKTRDSFFRKYGHLRPDTYNILNNRYDSMKEMITAGTSCAKTTSINVSYKFKKSFNHFLKEHKFKINYDQFKIFLSSSIKNREYYKFEYTKVISEILEQTLLIGDQLNLSKEELSYLDYDVITLMCQKNNMAKLTEEICKSIANDRVNHIDLMNQIALPSLLFNKNNLSVITNYTIQPNFITNKVVEGVVIDGTNLINKNIDNKIVIIKNADPGYDWIFSHKIKGLVTQYGGLASHMAIRCAEFNIPASIGCGQLIFNQIKISKKITLDCKNKRLTKA